MPRFTALSLLVIAPAVLLASCAPGAQLGVSTAEDALSATLQVWPAPGSTPGDALAGAAEVLLHQSPSLAIQFRYPAAWYLQETPADLTLSSYDPSNPPHKLEWTDKTMRMHFALAVLAAPPGSFEEWVEGVRQAALAQNLEIFAEERLQIAGQPAARLTLVSGSGGILHRVLAHLYGRYFEIDIEGNYSAAAEVLASIEPLTAGGLKPPDREAPAAGICAEQQEDPAVIVLGLGPDGLPLAGRCIALVPTQRLRVLNRSGAPIRLPLGSSMFNLEDGEEAMRGDPVGQYLAPGVHLLPVGPELWIRPQEPVAPTAVPPGPTLLPTGGAYVNAEVGYQLVLPAGWRVDEYGMAYSLNKEVLFSPQDSAEPGVTYLSVSLDFRTLDQIMNLYAQSVPEAARSDVVLNGHPGVRYTYAFRQEYYFPYGARVFAVLTDRPGDAGVQSILQTLRFTDPQPELELTMEDNGRTVSLRPGQSFRLRLVPGLNWSVTISDPAVIDAAAGVYLARAAGSATLSAVGHPACQSLTPPCLAPSLGFEITLLVQ